MLLRRIGVPERQMIVATDAQSGLAAVEAGVANGVALLTPANRRMAAHDRPCRAVVGQPWTQPNAAFVRGPGYASFAFRPIARYATPGTLPNKRLYAVLSIFS